MLVIVCRGSPTYRHTSNVGLRHIAETSRRPICMRFSYKPPRGVSSIMYDAPAGARTSNPDWSE